MFMVAKVFVNLPWWVGLGIDEKKVFIFHTIYRPQNGKRFVQSRMVWFCQTWDCGTPEHLSTLTSIFHNFGHWPTARWQNTPTDPEAFKEISPLEHILLAQNEKKSHI